MTTRELFLNRTTQGVTPAQRSVSATKTIQGSGSTTSGTGNATIQVQASLDELAWDVIGTITLVLGTALVSDSFTSDDRYRFLRGNVSVLNGTGASVSLKMGT